VILYDGKTGERLSELGAPAHTGSIYGLCWDSTSRFIELHPEIKQQKFGMLQQVQLFKHINLVQI